MNSILDVVIFRLILISCCLVTFFNESSGFNERKKIKAHNKDAVAIQLTITPEAPSNVFVTNYTKRVKFSINDATNSDCQGLWSVTITTSSTGQGFVGESISFGISVDSDGYGEISRDLLTPPSEGIFIINATVTKSSCSDSPLSADAFLISSICPNNGSFVNLATQSDVDNFASNSCIDFLGVLVIGPWMPPSFNNTSNEINNLGGLSNLLSVEELWIIGNENLVNLNGLENITKIKDLYLYNNDALTDLSALSNLKTIEKLSITGNDALPNLEGLNNFKELSDELEIRLNASLTSIDALSGLDEVGEIVINENMLLTSLSGLENINPSLLTDLELMDNPQLSICAISGICDYLDAGGTAFVGGNAVCCQSVSEIQMECGNGLSDNTFNATPQGSLTDYTPNSTKTITFTFDEGCGFTCNGDWLFTAISSSSDPDFVGQTFTSIINTSITGSASIDVTFPTPASGSLDISASVDQDACEPPFGASNGEDLSLSFASECGDLTFTITPEIPINSYTPESEKEFTFSITNACPGLCQGTWALTAVSSSNYANFIGQTLTGNIVVGSDGTGFINLTFQTPFAGNLIINATAVNVSCPGSPYGITQSVSASVEINPTVCDTPFSEDFNSLAEGTGINLSTGPSSVAVGQGTASPETATFGFSGYFEVRAGGDESQQGQNAFAMVGASLGGSVKWESNPIPVGECCTNRNGSVLIFGSGVTDDPFEIRNNFVKVSYEVVGNNSIPPVILGQAFGNFNNQLVTFTINGCGTSLSPGDEIKIVIEVSNGGVGAIHGFDNVQIGTGTLSEGPDQSTLNAECEGDETSTTITLSAVTDYCGPNFFLNGNLVSNPVTLPSNATYNFTVRDATFGECGEGTIVAIVNQFGECVFLTGENTLPVELTSLNAELQENATILYWQTISEVNNKEFVVERSGDNDAKFQKIGVVEGAGYSTKKQYYQFTDSHLLKGLNYYRLQQVDFDGTHTYSDIVSVNWEPKSAMLPLIMAPNPAKDQVTLTNPNNQDLTISLYDLNGKFMQSLLINGDQSQLIGVKGWASGVYFVRVKGARNTISQRFVKQ